MKDFDGILLFILGTVVAGLVFWGVIGTIKKAFRPAAHSEVIDSTRIMKDQKDFIVETKKDQKRLRREQEQKLRDLRRQF